MQEALTIASTAVNASLAGFLPAVLWLWFWLKEDPHPEPRRVLIFTFLAGMTTVPLALLAENLVYAGAKSLGIAEVGGVFLGGGMSALMLFLWAGVEEYFKYLAAKWSALRLPSFDEPVDAPIYLITSALGFAALENLFFLFRVYYETPELGIATGQMRFLGATLLHVISSAVVGMGIAFSFFHPRSRRRNVFWGLITATLLHALFNIFIIKNGDGGIFKVFFFVWIGAVALLILFEKIKRLKRDTNNTNTRQ